MPQLPSCKSLQDLSIEAIARDSNVKSFEYLQVPPDVAFDILRRKLYNRTLELEQIEGPIRPGLKYFELEACACHQGEDYCEESFKKIMSTVGAKCRLKVFSINPLFHFDGDCFQSVLPALKETKKVQLYLTI